MPDSERISRPAPPGGGGAGKVRRGEEYGGIGAGFLISAFPELFDDLNRRHRFVIELDRRGGGDFKCYDVGTESFRAYVGATTSFTEPDRSSFTDIVFLCRDICGANLSCGYHDEHTASEHIVKKEWHHTLTLLRTWLAADELPKFPLGGVPPAGSDLSGLLSLWRRVRPRASSSPGEASIDDRKN